MKFKIIFSVFATGLLMYACNDNDSSSNNAIEKAPITSIETPQVEVKGQSVFEQKCAACHGSDGTAGIGNAANLQRSKMEKISVSKTITDGKGGMPSFKGQLTKDEMADISNYVLTLRK